MSIYTKVIQEDDIDAEVEKAAARLAERLEHELFWCLDVIFWYRICVFYRNNLIITTSQQIHEVHLNYISRFSVCQTLGSSHLEFLAIVRQFFQVLAIILVKPQNPKILHKSLKLRWIKLSELTRLEGLVLWNRPFRQTLKSPGPVQCLKSLGQPV